MLSRFGSGARAPLRRCLKNSARFNSVLEAGGKTNTEIMQEIENLPNVDGDELSYISRVADDAFELKPVTKEGLVDAIAQQSINELQNEEYNDEGFLEAVGLGPFHRRASLVVTGALTALSNEFYVMNEETMVAGCLLAGFTTMHVLLREPALDWLNGSIQGDLKAQNEAEDKHIAACQTLINSQSGSEHIVDAVKAAFTEKEELVHIEAQAKAILEKNKVAKDFENKLQALVNAKSEEEAKAYKALIDNVYGEVLQAASSDKKFQKAALKYAIDAITTPEKAGANPTVTLFESKLKQ